MSAHRDFGAAVSDDACGRIWFQGWLSAALLTRKIPLSLSLRTAT